MLMRCGAAGGEVWSGWRHSWMDRQGSSSSQQQQVPVAGGELDQTPPSPAARFLNSTRNWSTAAPPDASLVGV